LETPLTAKSNLWRETRIGSLGFTVEDPQIWEFTTVIPKEHKDFGLILS